MVVVVVVVVVVLLTTVSHTLSSCVTLVKDDHMHFFSLEY